MDSFNSADPNHSVWQTGMTYHGMPYGVYSDSLSYNSNSLPSRTANFWLATDGQIINVGTANIYGYVDTAPGGTANIGADGSVGDLNWVYDEPGIEPGHVEDNMNVSFSSRNLPVPVTASQTNWWPIPTAPGGSTNIGGVTYSLLITNQLANSNFVYYSIGQLTQNIFIDASNVVLYLTNGMGLAGSIRFTLNSNADVSIYSSGNISVSGTGGIANLTQNALALRIYDVAGYTNLTFSFPGSFGAALVYAPNSSVRFLGGGSAAYSVIGAIFCENLSVNGHYIFITMNPSAAHSFQLLHGSSNSQQTRLFRSAQMPRLALWPVAHR